SPTRLSTNHRGAETQRIGNSGSSGPLGLWLVLKRSRRPFRCRECPHAHARPGNAEARNGGGGGSGEKINTEKRSDGGRTLNASWWRGPCGAGGAGRRPAPPMASPSALQAMRRQEWLASAAGFAIRVALRATTGASPCVLRVSVTPC